MSWSKSLRIVELLRLLYGGRSALSLRRIGTGLASTCVVSILLSSAADSCPLPAIDVLRLPAVFVSFSWIVKRFVLTRGCDSFSRKATKASVKLTLLLTLSFDPLENQPPSPPPLLRNPTREHSASSKCKTFAISFRI